MKLIKLECPNCHAALEVDGERETAYCQYCGTKLLLDDETIKVHTTIRDEAEIERVKSRRDIELAKLKFKKKQYEDERRPFKIWIGTIIVLVCLAVVVFWHDNNVEEKYKQTVEAMAEEGKFSIGSYRDFRDIKYKAAIKLLQSAGFTDIEKVHLDDRFILSSDNGKVESISINGNATFSRDDFWDGTEHVIVTYH